MRYDKFTLLEVFFRFITLLYSIGVTFAYFWRIRNFPYEDWAYEQKWTGLLLFLLIGFNSLPPSFRFFWLTVPIFARSGLPDHDRVGQLGSVVY